MMKEIDFLTHLSFQSDLEEKKTTIQSLQMENSQKEKDMTGLCEDDFYKCATRAIVQFFRYSEWLTW